MSIEIYVDDLLKAHEKESPEIVRIALESS